MLVTSDRAVITEGFTSSVEIPTLFAGVIFDIDLKTRKGCPMQCIGECSCKPEPCKRQCFCVAYCPRHKRN